MQKIISNCLINMSYKGRVQTELIYNCNYKRFQIVKRIDFPRKTWQAVLFSCFFISCFIRQQLLYLRNFYLSTFIHLGKMRYLHIHESLPLVFMPKIVLAILVKCIKTVINQKVCF